MKKLLPLILLVACADPNAELLAKFKNLEIENSDLKNKLEYSIHDKQIAVNEFQLRWNSCMDDLKFYTCKYGDMDKRAKKLFCK